MTTRLDSQQDHARAHDEAIPAYRAFDDVVERSAQGQEEATPIRLSEFPKDRFHVVATPSRPLSAGSISAGDLVLRRALGEGKLASWHYLEDDPHESDLTDFDGTLRRDTLVLRSERTDLRRSEDPPDESGAGEVLTGAHEAGGITHHCFDVSAFRSLDVRLESGLSVVTPATATTPPVTSLGALKTLRSTSQMRGFRSSFLVTPPGSNDFHQIPLGATIFDGTNHFRRDPADASKFQVRIRGSLCHPASTSRPGRFPRGGPFPLAIIVMGNHVALDVETTATGAAIGSTVRRGPGGALLPARIFSANATVRNEVESFRGYRYLQEHLASMGIISVSVDTNAANFLGSLIRFRADLTLAMLDHLRSVAATSGSPLAGKVDFRRVALIGHSRGGDAVAMAAKLNRTRPRSSRFGIKAVVALSPTDFTGMLPVADRLAMKRDHTRSFLCVYGSHDGDVSGNFATSERSPGWSRVGTGFRHYDRAAVPRAMVFLHGSTHNRFNTVWIDPAAHPGPRLASARALAQAQADHPADVLATNPASPSGVRDPRVLTASEHQTLANDYIGGWLAFRLLRRRSRRRLFTGETANRLSKPAALQWHLDRRNRTVDNFDDPDATKNLLRGSIASPSFTRERLIELTGPGQSPHHDKTLEATSATGTNRVYRTRIPSRLEDFRPFSHLTFRISKHFPNVSSPAAIAGATFPPVFEVALFDGTRRRSVDQATILSLNTHTLRPYHRLFGGLNLTKVHLQTWRVPLSRFTSGSSGISLDKVKAIEITFNAGANEPIHLDTLAVVKR